MNEGNRYNRKQYEEGLFSIYFSEKKSHSLSLRECISSVFVLSVELRECFILLHLTYWAIKVTSINDRFNKKESIIKDSATT